MNVVVRTAVPSQFDAIGALTLAAYTADGLLDDDSDYAHELSDAARRAAHATLLAAIDEDGTTVGTVTFCLPGSPFAELSRPGQAEFRMLAVAPPTRGQGVGLALVRECIRRAEMAGCTSMVISTRPQMVSAHRLYERLLFEREPGLDWEPEPGFPLLAYTRKLSQ